MTVTWHERWATVLLVLVALAASTLSGATGFGGAVLLLPALAAAYSLRDAVAVLRVTQVRFLIEGVLVVAGSRFLLDALRRESRRPDGVR